MTRIVLHSRVGVDGVLRLDVPIGSAEADHQMQVTIEPVPTATTEVADYICWLDQVAGKWQGEFEGLPQEGFEDRDSF